MTEKEDMSRNFATSGGTKFSRKPRFTKNWVPLRFALACLREAEASLRRRQAGNDMIGIGLSARRICVAATA